MQKKTIICFLCVLLSFSLLCISCGGSVSTTDDLSDSTDPSTNSGSPVGLNCSLDGSSALAVGTYTYTLNSGRKQVRILRNDCSYCSSTLDENETVTDIVGTWSSEYRDPQDQGDQEIIVTLGSVNYELSADGDVLEALDFALFFYRDDNTNISCGNEIVL